MPSIYFLKIIIIIINIILHWLQNGVMLKKSIYFFTFK
jgi:hypothetical protein